MEIPARVQALLRHNEAGLFRPSGRAPVPGKQFKNILKQVLTTALSCAILSLAVKKFLKQVTPMGELNIFKVLADPQRREILTMLRDGRMNAGEIAQRLGVSPAALSYHLKLLKAADLVLEYKEKNYVYYEVNTSVFQELILWVSQFGAPPSP